MQRQRRPFHHQTSLALVRANDTVYLEGLQVANMVRNRYLAKSISDAGRVQFRTILEARRTQAACAECRVVAVPPAYTSQDYSGCGAGIPNSLSVRTHVCPSCRLVMDRDEIAAQNMLRAGQTFRGAVA